MVTGNGLALARFWLLESGPCTPWFRARGSSTGAWSAQWVYSNADGFPQAAYRLRLWQEVAGVWTVIEDTDWVSSSATQHSGTGISAGEYLVTLELRDADAEENGYWQASIVVGEGAPSATDAPPAAMIVLPAPGDTVAGSYQVAVAATDDNGLSWAKLLIDGTEVASWMPGGYGVRSWSNTHRWDTQGVSNGQHTLLLQVTDDAGQTAIATTAITVQNSGGTGGSQPPTVAITSPADGATVGGHVNVAFRALDDTGLNRVTLDVGGTVVRTWSPGGSGQTQFLGEYALDTWALANGSHTLTVTVWDIAGNSATASITVTVSNTGTPGDLVLVTEPLTDSNAFPVVADGATPKLALVTVQTGAVPTDPRQRYNVRVGVHSPGTSVAWEDYTPVPLRRAFVPTVPFRLMLTARPQVTWSTWSREDCAEFIRVLLAGDRVILVGSGPVSVWELRASGLVMLADLETDLGVSTVTDAAVLGDKVFIATDLGPVAFDLDPDELPIALRLDATGVACHAVAAGSDVAYMRLGTKLYSFVFPQPRLLSSTAPVSDTPGGNLVVAGSALYAASADTGEVTDAVYRLDGTSLTKLYDTEQPVRRLWSRTVSGQAEVWAGCDDGVHVSRPQWQADGAGTFTGAVRAFAEFGGYLWAAGEVGGLWRREADGWALYDALTGVECVWDMVEVDGRLLIACRYDNEGTDNAQLLALSIDEGGAFVCGPTPPDVYLTLLTSTRAR